MRLSILEKETPWCSEYSDYKLKRTYYMHDNISNNLKLDKDNPKRYAEDDRDNNEIRMLDLKNRITYINGFKQTLEEADINFDENNLPENPMGRTGMWGPGLLGKNGPNQAADPIFTRWAPFTMYPLFKSIIILLKFIFTVMHEGGIYIMLYNVYKEWCLLFPHLEMIAIQRFDTKEWAIPGGMVETGETVSETLRKEINEEACNNMDTNDASKEIDKILSKDNGTIIYRGYVDDPRNTDTRWMETTAVHFHCTSKIAKAIKLEAGDDAQKVQWLKMTNLEPRYNNLYASHKMMTDKVKAKYTKL